MLILGEKYIFTKLEIQRLNKKFNTITNITYKDKNPADVISQIENSLNNTPMTIVLNTKAKVHDDIIKYLTNLKFKINKNKLNIISIEHFLEKYLHKCYIPENHDDLHYLDDIQGFTLSQRVFKRVVDICSALVLFVVLFFVKFKVKRYIKAQSPGDIYFHQSRVGLDNKKFVIVKFRTMHIHDTHSDIRTATKDDDRVFEFGAKMRKKRIDEIPQVFNLFRGDISLIGPRPEWDKLVDEYESHIPYYNQRHVVKPGITGWAQVMFAEGRNKDDTRQKLMYDLYYIKHYSWKLELKIVLKTIAVIFNKKGI